MNDKISIAKARLRKQFLNRRDAMSPEEVERKSAAIIRLLKEHSLFKNTGTLHTYVSMSRRHEVHTHSLIKECLEGGKKIVLPRMYRNGTLKHHYISSFEGLTTNAWGVQEPAGRGPEATLSDIDLVVVPMVAGDLNKNRLGYGKGYYDRFLKECPAPKAGLLFECQLSDQDLPVAPFDVPLDMLITESRVIL